MKNFFKIYFLFICIIAILGACGTKGNLYLPEKQYPQPASSEK